ncbi:MAG: hypothetical protein IPN90_01320 [Elusimicrobia bacterium]|nr:hypothetical protein [Elusimicrobiota bacterium]
MSESVRMPQLRLTIDYESDLRFANELLNHFQGRVPTLKEIVSHCAQLPEYPRVKEDRAAADEIRKNSNRLTEDDNGSNTVPAWRGYWRGGALFHHARRRGQSQ